MEEFPARETTRPPLLPSRIELKVRSGAAEGTKLFCKASRDGDFMVSHFSLLFDARSGCVKPRVGSGEKTPCAKFSGGLPALSSGFIGTRPSLPFWRTKTAVDAR